MIVQLTDGVEFVVNSLKSESNKRTYHAISAYIATKFIASNASKIVPIGKV